MAVLDPRALICLLVLIVNDWFLKAAIGNWVTGKLSDIAGIVVLAVLLTEGTHWLGLDRRTASRFGAVLAGASLAAIKLSSSAALFVTDAAAGVGINYAIVVDPTDLVALAILPVALAIGHNPRPLNFRPVARRTLLFAAVVACTASGVDGTLGLDFVEPVGDDTVVVGQRLYGEDAVRVADVAFRSTPDGWESARGAESPEWSLTTEACSAVDPQVCLRLGPGSRVSESTDMGVSYRSVWEIDDGPWWIPASTGNLIPRGSPELMEATDIAWTADGQAFVAISDGVPLRRSVDGTYSPSIADLHPFPFVTAAFFAAAWFVAATSLRIASERQTRRGTGYGSMSVLCLVAGGLMRSAADGFGILPAILVAAPLGAVFFLIALLVQGRASRGDVALGPMPVWKMGAPFIPLLLAAYAWDLDLLSWALTLIIMVATVGIGFIVTRPSTVAASAT